MGAYAKIKPTLSLNNIGRRIRKMRQSHFNFSPITHFSPFANMTMYMPGMGIAAIAVSMRAGQSENRQLQI
jgi:hypothetical protein